MLKEAREYGFNTAPSFSWPVIKAARDAYIRRLNSIYDANLTREKVPWFHGSASLSSSSSPSPSPSLHSVSFNGQSYYARHILVATGVSPFEFFFLSTP